jgi:phosphoglycolate phosphatase
MKQTPRYRAVLFDLDGTLTDPFLGISRSVNHALTTVGRPTLDAAALRRWIGPPLYESFFEYLQDAELATAAVAHYRARYIPIGSLENRLLEGIPELLHDLRAAGARLFVATSKIREPTVRILEHFNLLSYFEQVGAPEPGSRDDKAAVIEKLLPTIGADQQAAVMIGDTVFDIHGARAHAIPTIAVRYGYGTHEELAAARPHAAVDTVEELRGHLFAPGLQP